MPNKRAPGFTLLEIIIGMVFLAIALTGVLSVMVSQTKRVTDPVQQVRAAELAQRILNEILAKPFDQNSDQNGSHWRCGEVVNNVSYPACTAQAQYGPDAGETTPYLFSDVDDFHTPAICTAKLTGANCVNSQWVSAAFFTQNSSGLQNEYANFYIRILVTPTSWSPACTLSGCQVGKQVDLTVMLPDGSQVPFTLIRGNY